MEEKQTKESPSNTYDYLMEYDTFVKTYQTTEISAEEVGLLIVRMVNHFANINIRLQKALREYSKVIAILQNSVDEKTGKPMTSSKAESLAAASVEADSYNGLKSHVQNLEQIINGLKSLQKGLLMEYANAI